MYGNVKTNPNDTDFGKIVEILQWYSETAAPQYSVEFGSVFNAKLLVLVGLSLIFVSLDILDVRQQHCSTSHDRTVFDGVWREFYLFLLWRRIHTTATSVRDIYSVAVPEINLSKLEHAAQRLTTCVGESCPSQLMKMMISASIRL